MTSEKKEGKSQREKDNKYSSTKSSVLNNQDYDSNKVEDSFTATVVEPEDVDDILLKDASITLIEHDKDNVTNVGLSHDEVYEKTKKIIKYVYGQLLDGENTIKKTIKKTIEKTITMDMECYPEWVVDCDINGTRIIFKWDKFGTLTKTTKIKK